MRTHMKRLYRTLVCFAVVLCFLLAGSVAYAAPVRVSLPGFDITINNLRIDNAAREYPFIVYKDISYFPMTYHDCRFLGLASDYTVQDGLEINRTGFLGSYREEKASSANPLRDIAQTLAFPIRVNGKAINNSDEEYPLLLYKNISYFPLTWRFAVDEFGWAYYFDESQGLMINSFDYDEMQEALGSLYDENQLREIVNQASRNFQSSEWLTVTFRNYSRYQDRFIGVLHEHRPSETRWGDFEDFTLPATPDVPGIIERIPDDSFSGLSWRYYEGRPCLLLAYEDEIPTSMPIASESGTVGGSIDAHMLYFDIDERCLRSYWAVSLPVLLDEDGGWYVMGAVPTRFYSVMDFDYSPATIPEP